MASSVVPTMAPARAESAASVDTLQRSLVAAYEVQDFTAALDALRQLRQLEPEELRWIEADATISTDRKDFTRALKAYDAAYELARGDAGAEARILNGRALAREGIYDWPSALTDYDEVLRLAETNGFAPDPYVLNSRGNVRGSLGRWNDAKDDYESAGDLFQNAKGFRNGASTTQRLDGAIYAYSNKALATAQLGDEAGGVEAVGGADPAGSQLCGRASRGGGAVLLRGEVRGRGGRVGTGVQQGGGMRQVQGPRLRQAHPAVAAGDGRQALKVFIVEALIDY